MQSLLSLPFTSIVVVMMMMIIIIVVVIVMAIVIVIVIVLFTGAIPNQVRNSQTYRFAWVPGQNQGKSSRGDRGLLRLQSVMVADVWW